MLTRITTSKTYERLARHEIVRQFVKYAMVGALNVAVFLTLFNVLRHLGLVEVAAYVSAFVPTNVMSFFLNKRWAFRDDRQHGVVGQYLRFAFFTLISLGINTGAFALFLIPLRQYGRFGENIAALAPLPLSVTWNFLTYRFWTFSPNAGKQSLGSASA